MSEGSLDEHGVAIALIVSYGCLLVFTVSLLVGMLRSAGKCAWKPRYTFLALILLLTCLRLPNWILLLLQVGRGGKERDREKKKKKKLKILKKAHDANVTDEINRQWYFWALFNMCAMIYLTLFTELIVFWADLHDSLRPAVLDGSKRFTNKQRRFFQLMVLGFMWMVYVGVFVSFFFLSDFDTFNLIYSYVTCAFFAVSALVCAFVGIRVYRRVMEMPLRTVAVTARVRRVAITCAIVTFAFSARAILNGVLPSLQHGFTDTQKWIL